jgi:fatty-acyl-CoA synthase
VSTTAIELDWLKQWATYSPAAVAFQSAESGAAWTYSELYFLSCQTARELRATYGINSGDRIAVLATNELEYISLFFASQRLGAILVPINFRLTAREINHIISDCEPKLLVVQHEFAGLLAEIGNSKNIINTNFSPEKPPSVSNLSVKNSSTATDSSRSIAMQTLWFDGDDSLQSRSLAWRLEFSETRGEETLRFGNLIWPLPFVGTLETTCMILYTSGTTGSPKGAMISNSMLHWNSLNTTLRLNLNQNDVSVSFLPLFHTGGWNVLLTPFVHRGARTVLLKKFDAEMVLSVAEKEKITILFGVPTTMDMLAQSPRFSETNLSTIRYAVVGGEPMSIDLIKIWQKKGIAIRQGYGLTEFGPNVFSLNEEDSLRKIGSVGFANFYIKAKVVDDDGLEVAVDEIGELLLSGPVCMQGYWRNAEATAETIENGWLKTGDLVRRDSENYFYVCGRKKDMFKSGGENVYPVEIEQILSEHPDVREVAVIGVSDEKWGEVGKAFVTLKASSSASESDLRNYCEKNLARFKIPRYFDFRNSLPKGDSGKILKRKLAEAASTNRAHQ